MEKEEMKLDGQVEIEVVDAVYYYEVSPSFS